MSYVNTANRPNPAAIFGALGVPGAFGLVLVLGLTITVVVPESVPNPKAIDITEIEVDPIIEPIVEPDVDRTNPEITPQAQELPPLTNPITEFDFDRSATQTVNKLPDLIDTTVIGTEPVDFGGPTIVAPNLAQDALPRGNAGNWITDADYRSSWINRGYSGVASFSLSINERGRVSDCSIIRSTGHDALDQATCRLLERRARFNPAKDSNGNAVAGTFDSSVNWRIPE